VVVEGERVGEKGKRKTKETESFTPFPCPLYFAQLKQFCRFLRVLFEKACYAYLIEERADRIARELDLSAEWEP